MAMIRLRGVRTHNLRGVHLDLRPGAWTALCGVSGSGKSSLAVHTLHAEAERRWLATLPAAHRLLADAFPRPDLDAATGLPPTAALLQDAPSPSARATVATLVGLQAPLAALWSACAECRSPVTGLPMRASTVAQAAAEAIAAAPGARVQVLFSAPAGERDPSAWIRRGFLRARLPDGSTVELERMAPGGGVEALQIVVDRLVAEDRHRTRLHEAIETAWRHGDGVCALELFPREGAPVWLPASEAPLCLASGLKAPRPTPALFSRTSPRGACPRCQGLPCDPVCAACGGSGLREEAGWFHLGSETFATLLPREARQARAWAREDALEALRSGPARELIDEIRHRLDCLERLGLGYLPLDRPAASLSLGEERRCRLAGLVGAPLSGLAWILDEPSTGLHPRDLPALHRLLRDLVAEGASLLTIEHDLHSLSAADHVVETGPGPGRDGGGIVADTSPAELPALDTPSGRWLSGRWRPPPSPPRSPWGSVRLAGASGRNLTDISVDVPLGVLVGLAGVSGSGKSSLAIDTLGPALAERLGRPVAARPLPFRDLSISGPLAGVEIVEGHGEAVRNLRSTVASLSGLLDPLRELFASLPVARERGWTASRFSPNVKGGRCEACEGLGQTRIELHLLPDAWAPCPHCDGRRYAPATLDVRWKGLDLSQVLDLDLEGLAPLVANHPKLGPLVARLVEVGLGHIAAGRRTSTLSGGELLRLRLISALGLGAARQRVLWILDEPSRGLHPMDVARLLASLEHLLDAGHAVLAISHDPFLLSRCAHILELGPGAGREGGRLLYSGDAAGLASAGTPSSESVGREIAS